MAQCQHTDTIDPQVRPGATGCEDCLRDGSSWVHLRVCQTCGHVGCCNSSPNRHATAHHEATGHPVIRSYEPGEDWFWCYVDDVGFRLPDASPAPSHTDGAGDA